MHKGIQSRHCWEGESNFRVHSIPSVHCYTNFVVRCIACYCLNLFSIPFYFLSSTFAAAFKNSKDGTLEVAIPTGIYAKANL